MAHFPQDVLDMIMAWKSEMELTDARKLQRQKFITVLSELHHAKLHRVPKYYNVLMLIQNVMDELYENNVDPVNPWELRNMVMDIIHHYSNEISEMLHVTRRCYCPSCMIIKRKFECMDMIISDVHYHEDSDSNSGEYHSDVASIHRGYEEDNDIVVEDDIEHSLYVSPSISCHCDACRYHPIRMRGI